MTPDCAHEKLLLERRLEYLKLTDELLHVDEPFDIEYRSFHGWFLDKELCDVNTRAVFINLLEILRVEKSKMSHVQIIAALKESQRNNYNKEGSETRLKTLREILKTSPTKPRETVKGKPYLKENVNDSGAISSEFAYISRFAQYYDNQIVVEQIESDIMAMSKWTDVAVSVIAISEE